MASRSVRVQGGQAVGSLHCTCSDGDLVFGQAQAARMRAPSSQNYSTDSEHHCRLSRAVLFRRLLHHRAVETENRLLCNRRRRRRALGYRVFNSHSPHWARCLHSTWSTYRGPVPSPQRQSSRPSAGFEAARPRAPDSSFSTCRARLLTARVQVVLCSDHRMLVALVPNMIHLSSLHRYSLHTPAMPLSPWL